LFLTSRRSQINRSTLAIGTSAGLLFGLVMYAVAPLGLSKNATNPWLPGSQADPLVALAWILLIGGQGIAAGVLANGTAALFVSAFGTGTTALMLRSSWLLHRLNHGHQLTAIAAYRYEANASSGVAAYLFMLIWFPVVGLVMSALGAACTPLGRTAPGELTPVPPRPGNQYTWLST
jgi:hypothetical protein